MLSPNQFDTDDEIPAFTLSVSSVVIGSFAAGPVDLDVRYDREWRPIFYLGGLVPISHFAQMDLAKDHPAYFKLSGNDEEIKLIITKFRLRNGLGELEIEARLHREPLVIIASDVATTLEGVLLSSPNFYGREVVLRDEEMGEFSFQRLKESSLGLSLFKAFVCVSSGNPLERLACLNTFLTFVKGSHCGLGNITAYDGDGLVAFELLGFTRNDCEKPKTNWFDIEILPDLSEIYLRFSKAFRESFTREAIKQAVAFYRASNASRDVSIEMSIIAAHSGLEALVNFVLCYRAGWSEGLVEKSQIKFSDKLRAASAYFGVDDEILNHSPELRKISKNRGMDAFEIISFFRNKIVHQDKKFQQTGIQLHEVWLLSQWLVEVLVFSIIGYSGEIIDRRVYSGWRGTKCEIPSRF